MTAKTRHGMKAHRATHGADEGSRHERMNKMHAMPNRAEGQPMSAAQGPSAQPMAPPSMAPSPMAAPPGAGMSGPSMDTEEGDQTS